MGPDFLGRLLRMCQDLIQKDEGLKEVVSLLKEYVHNVADGKGGKTKV